MCVCMYLYMYSLLYLCVVTNRNNPNGIKWSFVLINSQKLVILLVVEFCFYWVYLSYMSVVLMQTSWCHILRLMHLIQAVRVPLLSQSFLLQTKQPVLSFVLVRLLYLRDVLLGVQFLWRYKCTSSVANLLLVCLHHVYHLFALWQCVHKRNCDNIV